MPEHPDFPGHRRPTGAKETVHALSAGVTLCGEFSTRVPREWPNGHSFVPNNDIRLITCVVCKEKAVELERIRGVGRKTGAD